MKKKNNIKDEFKQLLEPALVVMYSLGFMVLQKDLGSALIFFFCIYNYALHSYL